MAAAESMNSSFSHPFGELQKSQCTVKRGVLKGFNHYRSCDTDADVHMVP